MTDKLFSLQDLENGKIIEISLDTTRDLARQLLDTMRENERLRAALIKCSSSPWLDTAKIADAALNPDKHSNGLGKRVMYTDETPSREYEG